MKAGRCPAKPGNIDGLSNRILPEKLNSLQEPFLAAAELCLKSCAPFGGTLIPNGEAMLAEQFLAAAAGRARPLSLDETARLLWRAHAEAQIPDAEAEAISEAIEARRAALAGKRPHSRRGQPLAFLGPLRRPGTREDVWHRPPPSPRSQRQGQDHALGALPGPQDREGPGVWLVTAKALAVLEALLWGFHNAKSGLCFPSYERIAEAAGCARSTVAEALKALEEAGVLSWVQRIKRVREPCPDLLGDNGWRWRVLEDVEQLRLQRSFAGRRSA